MNLPLECLFMWAIASTAVFNTSQMGNITPPNQAMPATTASMGPILTYGPNSMSANAQFAGSGFLMSITKDMAWLAKNSADAAKTTPKSTCAFWFDAIVIARINMNAIIVAVA